MSAKPDGGPAFPVPFREIAREGKAGMTLRQWLAAAALQGFCANPGLNETSANSIADLCVIHADALISKLQK